MHCFDEVIIACRSASRGEEARKELLSLMPQARPDTVLTVMPCDLSDLSSVTAFVGTLREHLQQSGSELSLIVANAGVMGTPFSLTQQGYSMQMGTNHLGHACLLETLTPLLPQGARVVVVSSSEAHTGRFDAGDFVVHAPGSSGEGYDKYREYANSKLANVVFADHLAQRLRSRDVAVVSLHPGCPSTQIARNMGVLSTSFIQGVARRFIQISPQESAAYVAQACLVPDVQQSSGAWFHMCSAQESPSTRLTAADKDAILAATYKALGSAAALLPFPRMAHAMPSGGGTQAEANPVGGGCKDDPFAVLLPEGDRVMSRDALAAVLRGRRREDGGSGPLRLVPLRQVSSMVEELEKNAGKRQWAAGGVVVKVVKKQPKSRDADAKKKDAPQGAAAPPAGSTAEAEDGGKQKTVGKQQQAPRKGRAYLTVKLSDLQGAELTFAVPEGRTSVDLRAGVVLLLCNAAPFRKVNPVTHEVSFSLSAWEPERQVHVVGHLKTLAFCTQPVVKKTHSGEKKQACNTPIDRRASYQGMCQMHARLAMDRSASSLLCGGNAVRDHHSGKKRAFADAAAGLLAKRAAACPEPTEEQKKQSEEEVKAKRLRVLSNPNSSIARRQAYAAVMKKKPAGSGAPPAAPAP